MPYPAKPESEAVYVSSAASTALNLPPLTATSVLTPVLLLVKTIFAVSGTLTLPSTVPDTAAPGIRTILLYTGFPTEPVHILYVPLFCATNSYRFISLVILAVSSCVPPCVHSKFSSAPSTNVLNPIYTQNLSPALTLTIVICLLPVPPVPLA